MHKQRELTISPRGWDGSGFSKAPAVVVLVPKGADARRLAASEKNDYRLIGKRRD